MNYVQLQEAVLDFLARPGDPLVAPAVPLMIQLFEAEANRRLKVGAAEKYVTLTTVAGSAGITLPDDCVQVRRVSYNGYTLAYVPPDTLPGLGGPPLAYTIWGDTVLWVGPLPDAAYTLEVGYQSGVPPLATGDGTNWLLGNHPDAYLFGTLMEAEAYVGHDERVTMWAARREAAFASIEQADRKARWGSPLQVRVHGITIAPGSASAGGEAVGGGTATGGGSRVFIDDNPPSQGTVHEGDLWWCSSSSVGGGQLYVFYVDPGGAPGQWVAATNQPVGDSAGIVSLTPASGDTIDIARGTPSVYISSGALAALTVRLWASPVLGETAQLSFANPVTALAVQTSGGVAIPDGPTSAYGPGAALIFRAVDPGPAFRYWK